MGSPAFRPAHFPAVGRQCRVGCLQPGLGSSASVPPLQQRQMPSHLSTSFRCLQRSAARGRGGGAQKTRRVVRGAEGSSSQPERLFPVVGAQAKLPGRWDPACSGSCCVAEQPRSLMLFLLAPQAAGNAKFWLCGHLLLV